MNKYLKIKHIGLVLTLGLLTFSSLFGQDGRLEVLATAGDDVKKGKYQLSYTLGETVTITQGNRFYFVTQGFHQVEWNAVIVWEYQPEEINLEVFPNPYSRNLTITVPAGQLTENFSYRIVDFTFKEVAFGELSSDRNELELSYLPAATYLLNISKNQELIKTFRIIKSH